MIIGHVNDLGKLDSQSRDVLCDEHREDVDLLEKRLRHEYDVQVQVKDFGETKTRGRSSPGSWRNSSGSLRIAVRGRYV